jgi:hypothetical protein
MPIFGSEVSANRARDLILREFRARFATSNMVCDGSIRGARASKLPIFTPWRNRLRKDEERELWKADSG